MNPIEIIKKAIEYNLTDEDNEEITIELLRGLDEREISEFENKLPCKLPEHIKELLKFCRGFDGPLEIDFTGENMTFMCDLFPNGIPFAADGFGNFWVIDLNKESIDLAPIYFCCHDAPIILYQCDSIQIFLDELFKIYLPPRKSLVDDVHEDRIKNVWTKNPDLLPYHECSESNDEQLKDFAKELDEKYQIIDMRYAKPGDGFSWGRFGPKTINKRYGELPIFAYRKPEKQGFFNKLFGKKN